MWPADREESSGSYPGIAGYEPDLAVAHNQGKRAKDEFRKLVQPRFVRLSGHFADPRAVLKLATK